MFAFSLNELLGEKMQNQINFQGINALFINCSIKPEKSQSHTQLLIDKVSSIMSAEGVSTEQIFLNDHTIAFGMVKDVNEHGKKDDWPEIQQKIMKAEILVIGSPIWLGVKSSLATLAIERMYAYSGDRNEKDQYLYYGKTGGCIITGNEDGIKHCSMDILYALSHIGYMIPPQADCGWIGEAGPGGSYGDTEYGGEPIGDGKTPLGYDNDFTNRNATFMAWNLMHTAKMLKDNSGITAKGNTTSDWEHVTNAKSFNPEYL